MATTGASVRRRRSTGATLRRWWSMKVTGGVAHAEVLDRLTAQSGWSGRYLFHIVIAAGISILGLLLPSSAVLIGAMLISPLMMPILGLGFGIATFDLAEIRRAGLALALGSLIAIVLSTAFVAVSPLQTVTSEIAARTRPNLFDLMVAMLSAIAGAYGVIRGQGGTVVGVAIAIALMPPLAVVGFGIATWNGPVAGGALLLFMTNLVSMALVAGGMARLYGFGSHLSPQQTRLQGTLIVVGLLALAVPLGIALRQIAWESVARRQIREAVLAPFPREARISQLDIDFDTQPVTVRAAVLTPRFARNADGAAIRAAGSAVGRRLDLHIDQLRVGEDEGGPQAAQIAAARTTDLGATPATGERDRVARRIALLAGVAPDAVLVDGATRRALVRMAPLPGATLATYRALADRAAAELDGWRLTMVPPVTALPPIAFDGDTPDATAVSLAGWAATTRGQPVIVRGAPARTAPVVEALRQKGVDATAERGPARSVTLDWGGAAQ
ncbi:MAG: DUF389 domain-containing protein [Sphingomonas adhaesiva]|uniref:DUF389 domain-containing protein n=1 Tax=Sphingomonas adhaesiva TaxID=28212 RepID=UPI002FF9B680